MNKYLKYTGLAFQMGATIGVLTYLGVYLDQRYAMPQPWFTIALALLAIIGSTVKLIIDLNKNEDSN